MEEKYCKNSEKSKTLELEDHNFRVCSDGWTKKTQDNTEYLENQEEDIIEFTEGNLKGEQLFTWESAMRETKKVGKRIPTDEEFKELIKVKKDITNVIFAGCHNENGSFLKQGTYAFLWSSSESWLGAWSRYLYSSYTAVDRYVDIKALGFSVRCLKN